MSEPKYHQEIDLQLEGTSHRLMVDFVGSNKTVLDVGCSSGYLAKVLQAAGNTVSGIEFDPDAAELAAPYLAKIVVADLERTSLAEAFGDDRFEVIVFGDVLEHLRDPLTTLRQARQLLTPNGYIVVSIPNIAHGDVRMSLLLGRFNYTNMGLLDNTHVHFVTRSTLRELLRDAGFTATDVKVTKAPLFETELGVRRGELPDDVVDLIATDPDSTTYQFVLTAVPETAGKLAEGVAWDLAQAQLELAESQARERQLTIDVDAALTELSRLNLETRGEIAALRQLVADRDDHVDALESANSVLAAALKDAQHQAADAAQAAEQLAKLTGTRTFRLRRRLLRVLRR